MATNPNPSGQSQTRKVTWTRKAEVAFLEELLDNARTNDYQVKHIDNATWTQWANDMNNIFHLDVSVNELMSKMEEFKRLYKCYNAINRDISLNWNPKTRTVDCEQQIWDAFCKKHPIAETVKREGIRNYDMLHEIFAKQYPNAGARVLYSGSRVKRQPKPDPNLHSKRRRK